MERAKSDPEVFGLLFDRHVAGVYRFALSRLRDGAAAEDVTAEVFTRALRGLDSYRDQGKPFACWLYQIARNLVADHFRREPICLELPENMAGRTASVEDQAIRNGELRRIWCLVDRLPAQQRTAMILKFRDDRSPREVGAIMGKTEGAVKLLIYRALCRLRSELTPLPVDGAPASGALAAT